MSKLYPVWGWLFPILTGPVLLTGCVSTLAPDYHRPAAPVAKQWPTGQQSSASHSSADIPWRTLFADPQMQRLIQLALDNNRDLRTSTLNIARARAQYNIQRSALMPDIGINGDGSSGRTPALISTTGSSYVGHAYQLNVGISAYELDLFGRVRSLKDQALQQYLATEAAQRSARISLITEVATTYMNLSASQEQLTLARNTFASRQSTYDLQRQRFESGDTSELELRQSEVELESARDQVLSMENAVAMDRNALELLVGTPLPGDIQFVKPLDHMLARQDIPAGLPSDLLQRRPDIVSAEHSLMAANANIGAARAAFFPSIKLTAGIGRASDSLSSLFDGGNRSWSFAPKINLPIFSGGRLTAALEVAKVDRDIAVAEYERSIQSAFREVADALNQRESLDGRLAAQQRRVSAAQAAYDMAKARYDNGISGYLEVLDTQRTLYSVQKTLVETQLARQNNLITLYKALGGDWSTNERKATTARHSDTQSVISPVS